jgi:hypothetical protein
MAGVRFKFAQRSDGSLRRGEEDLMNTKKLAFAAAVAACFALLAACGGSASKDAAGTLMEAKPAAATEAPAAGAGANVAAEGDATVKSGEAANGAAASKPGCIYPMVKTDAEKLPADTKVCR